VSLVSVSCDAVTDGDFVLDNEEKVVALMVDSLTKSSVMSPEPSVPVGISNDDVSGLRVDPIEVGIESTVVVSLLMSRSLLSETADDVTGDVAVGASVLNREDLDVTEEDCVKMSWVWSPEPSSSVFERVELVSGVADNLSV